MVTGRDDLYRDGMTSADPSTRLAAVVGALWSAPTRRATRSVLAAMLVATVGAILLGGLLILCGAAVVSLVDWPVGGWSYAALYVAVVLTGGGGALVASCWLAPVVAVAYLATGHSGPLAPTRRLTRARPQ
jgi:hypothetical protein